MQQPTDSSGIVERPGMVCRLLKSLYGLRQAGEIWGSLLCEKLLSWGFKVTQIDKRMFFSVVGSEFIILVVVVDDMEFVSNSVRLMTNLKQNLSATFDVKLFGRIQTFIGWEFIYHPYGNKVTQKRYAQDIIARCGMEHCNAVGLRFLQRQTSLPVMRRRSAYQGSSFRISLSNRCLNPPCRLHSSRHLILRFCTRSPCPQSNHSTSSLAKTCVTLHRHSTSGYIITVNGGPVSWKSNKQTVIALSSAESEYVALSSCAKQVTWLRRIPWEIHPKRPFDVDDQSCPPPTSIFSDSTAAIALTKSETVSGRNKHIEIKVHHLKKLSKRKVINVSYVPTQRNIADLLTKPVDFKTLKYLTAISRM